MYKYKKKLRNRKSAVAAHLWKEKQTMDLKPIILSKKAPNNKKLQTGNMYL